MKEKEASEEIGGAGMSGLVPKLSDSKLKDLSWSLDVLDTKKQISDNL